MCEVFGQQNVGYGQDNSFGTNGLGTAGLGNSGLGSMNQGSFGQQQFGQQGGLQWFCPNCGSANVANFCQNCGTPKQM